MPLRFSSLPEHVQLSIIGKLSIGDFLKFHESSRECYNAALKTRNRFSICAQSVFVDFKTQGLTFNFSNTYMHLSDKNVPAKDLVLLPIRIQAKAAVILELGEESIQDLEYFLLKTNSSFSLIHFSKNLPSLETLDSLLEVANIREFSYEEKVSSDVLRLSAMKNINHLTLKCEMNDNEFLKLRMPKLHLSDTEITSEGINMFVKQWLKGERQITEIRMWIARVPQQNVIFDGIVHSIYEYLQRRIFIYVKRDDDEKLQITLYPGIPLIDIDNIK